jgi:hypothetical protein
MPYYIFNNAGRCMASCSAEPNQDDLDEREEIAVEDDRLLDITTLMYLDGVLEVTPPKPLPLPVQLQRAIKLANEIIAPLSSAVALGDATQDERALLEQWQRYSVALMRLPQQAGWPDPGKVVWPTQPKALA